jgi:predicted nucleotidyltransferase
MHTNETPVQPAEAGLTALEGLLGSKARARLLVGFTTHPTEEFYARQLVEQTRLSETAIRYELPRLVRMGLLYVRRRGQEKLYRINDRHPLFPELKQMVYKTAGLGEILRQAIGDIPGVLAAFIYGSVAKGGEYATSDIDLFILGTPDRARLAAALEEAERRLGREINLVTMTVDEWRVRAAAKEGFVEDLLRSPRIFLIGDEHSLRGT